MTQRFDTTDADLAAAALLLRDGSLVAFPTETVYGLGADATSGEAVESVFEAKGRPRSDPLIVHVADLEAAHRVGNIADAAEGTVRLAETFWPGPLTLVVHRTDAVSALVGGGGSSVGVRIPAHPVALRFLTLAEVPVAAPSANRFGRVSPTDADHVLDELGGVIDVVIDAGATPLGIESTVVDCTGDRPVLLRPGGLAVEDLLTVADLQVPGDIVVADGVVAPAPGMFRGHYAPSAPVVLVDAGGDVLDTLVTEISRYLSVRVLDLPSGPAAAAASLYSQLRSLDVADTALILAPIVEPAGIGRAINDRLLRSAHGRIAADAAPATVDRLVAAARTLRESGT